MSKTISIKKYKKILFTAIFLINLAAVFWLWTQGSSGSLLATHTNSDLLIAFGRLFGLIGEYFILVQLVLIGRLTPVEQLFGFDRLNWFHRGLGYVTGVLLVFHPVLLIIGYAHRGGVSLTYQFLRFINNWEDVFKALIGLVLLIVIVGISIAIVRRRLRYETWYFTHLFIYLAVALAFSHQTNTGDLTSGSVFWYWGILNFAVFGLILAYRFLKPAYLFNRHRFYIDKIVPETHNVSSVYITGRNMDRYKFESGQYANLTFLSRSMWFTHPFSFSAPSNGQFLRFSIKDSGDFTSQIGNLKPGTKVIIDGPLGIFTKNEASRTKFLFIAGGIGITPIRAVVESLIKEDGVSDLVLLYGNKNLEDVVFKTELEAMGLRQYLIFSQSSEPGYENGRIDQEKITRLVPDFKEREIYICGPSAMIFAVIKILKNLGVKPNQIHFEKFSY